MDCVFCRIVAGEIPSKKVFEDDRILAFYDIEPKTPVHVLVIPKNHISGASSVTGENSGLVAHIFEILPQIAQKLGIESFRVVTNNGAEAGQTVPHLHFHLLGGGHLGDMA